MSRVSVAFLGHAFWPRDWGRFVGAALSVASVVAVPPPVPVCSAACPTTAKPAAAGVAPDDTFSDNFTLTEDLTNTQLVVVADNTA